MERKRIRITSGLYKNRLIEVSLDKTLRPTTGKVKEALFSSLESAMNISLYHFYDFFSGTGSISFEALSRGFKKVYSFELNKNNFTNLKKNWVLFRDERMEVFLSDVIKNPPQKREEKPAVFFLDPPYDSDFIEKILCSMRDQRIVGKKDWILAESNREINIPQGFLCHKQSKYGSIFLHYLKKEHKE